MPLLGQYVSDILATALDQEFVQALAYLQRRAQKQNKFQKTELGNMVHSLGLKKETNYKTSFK